MRGIKLSPQYPALSHERLPALAAPRPFSSSSNAAAKPLVLDKPEKFQPPSHPSRLNARRIPRLYPGPPIPEAEKKAQATRKYPHTFPNEGTRMYWFLTNKYIHLWISLGTLFTLSSIILIQSFLRNSPFTHLTPPISSLTTSPFSFIRDWLFVIRMHQQYTSEQMSESRKKKVVDAQRRGLSRQVYETDHMENKGLGQGSSFAEEEQAENVRTKRRPVKKWLGIW